MHTALRRMSVPLQSAASNNAEMHLRVAAAADIVMARERVRAIAARTGFSVCDSTLITAAVSEISRNIVEHATQGELTITVVFKGAKTGIRIVVADRGPGIADIAQAMKDGYSSRHGMGIGLPGAKRLMDDFEITSNVGVGTTIVMTKWNAS
jgi:serine/threonine-protein kinase RsbT